MNKITFQHPKINDNQETSYFIPVSSVNEETIKNQIGEVLVEQHYQKGKIKKEMTIIDCGANIGLASIYFKDFTKVIYALEPNPKNYECLVENTKLYPHIKTFCLGLAARTTTEYLRTNGEYPIAESLFGTGDIREEVKLQSINQFMEEQKIEHVDLLKIDVEGSEYIIFPSFGFEKVASKIDYIIGEAHYFQELVPDYIPLMLNDAGFDMKFLPINNIFLKMSFNDDVVKKSYQIEKQTIFFAKRKELPWPS